MTRYDISHEVLHSLWRSWPWTEAMIIVDTKTQSQVTEAIWFSIPRFDVIRQALWHENYSI